MPDYLMNFSVYPHSVVEVRPDGLYIESLKHFIALPWHDIANEYEGVFVRIEKNGVVMNVSEKTAAEIRLNWDKPLPLTVDTKMIMTLTPILPQRKAKDIAYLVSYESLGCLPDSQYPAFTFKDAIAEARSMFEQERLEDGSWAWSVESGLTRSEVIDAMPYGCVYASENREHGLYRVVITAVDRETAEAWEE